MIPVSSWGQLTRDLHEVVQLGGPASVPWRIAGCGMPGLAFGMGRSYGDVCLNPNGVLWNTSGCDGFIAFDRDNGRLVAEAGVLLRDIQRLVVPAGWMLPVSPGTQLATLGGAIANDVHGKNHHLRGTFGHHIRKIRLVRTDGRSIECSPLSNPEWLAATIGGMGLTGVIAEAEVQLLKVSGPWLEAETIPFRSLEEFLQLADDSQPRWEHTVAWIDCVTRGSRKGLFIRGNPASVQTAAPSIPRTRAVPFTPPFSLVNRLTLRPLNWAYYTWGKWRSGTRPVHYERFFYPLDGLRHWNRMYGPAGFYQYQCVVPRRGGEAALEDLLSEISRSGEGSFLAVLKTFGSHKPAGLMSFAQEGITLALDFPNAGARTLSLFQRLDSVVQAAGGRLYPAKDARMPRALFEAGYPLLKQFLAYRDPGISSGLSRRLIGS